LPDDEQSQSDQSGSEAEPLTERDVLTALQFHSRGRGGVEILTDLDEGKYSWDSVEVESFFSSKGSDYDKEIVSGLAERRDTKEREAFERQERELASSDDALRAKIKADLAKEADDAAAVRREERLRAEVKAQLDQERAGTTGPDPTVVAATALTEISEQLDRRDLTEQERTDLWARADQAEAALASSAVITDVDPDDFEKRLDERMARGY
jgi:hypothetical protein